MTRLQREAPLDNATVSLDQTMVATLKAQIGSQATLQARDRLVQACTDIMPMQVESRRAEALRTVVARCRRR